MSEVAPTFTEVTIDTAGPTITIKAYVDLDTAKAAALEPFREAMALYPIPKALGPVGFANVERSSGPEYASAHPIDLRSGT